MEKKTNCPQLFQLETLLSRVESREPLDILDMLTIDSIHLMADRMSLRPVIAHDLAAEARRAAVSLIHELQQAWSLWLDEEAREVAEETELGHTHSPLLAGELMDVIGVCMNMLALVPTAQLHDAIRDRVDKLDDRDQTEGVGDRAVAAALTEMAMARLQGDNSSTVESMSIIRHREGTGGADAVEAFTRRICSIVREAPQLDDDAADGDAAVLNLMEMAAQAANMDGEDANG